MFRPQKPVGRRGEQGYILITLILFVALLAISLVAVLPVITQQIKRDREEEMIHRGVQYSRAIKHFYKKFNRYPNTIEELQNTNEIHFLRKRFKDPVTGKDFKILHYGDVQMSSGGGLAGATPVANMTGGNPGASGPFGSPVSGSGPFGSSGGVGPMAGPGGGFGASGPFGNNNSGFGNNGSAFGNNSSGFGNNGGNSFGGNSGFGGNSFGNNSGQVNNQTQANGQQPDNGSDAAPNQGGFGTPIQNLAGMISQESGNPNQAVIGGGPVVGVASISKDKTIRVFGKKDKYYQWQFIYDPSTDRGGLLTTPNQPNLQQAQGGAMQGVQGNQNGNQPPGFGSPQPPGFGSQPMQPGPGGGFGGQQPSPFGPQPPQQSPVPQMPPEQGPP